MQFVDFDQLDHNEYLASVALDSHWSDRLESLLDYRQERRMASFADRNSTDLALEDERIGRGTLTWALVPNWRVEGGLKGRELDVNPHSAARTPGTLFAASTS